MAKMFYTLEEAAEKLGKNLDEIRGMAKSGQIQEFRDRDKLMFKVDQIDLLTHDDIDEPHVDPDMSSMIPLAEDEPDESFADLSFDSGLESGAGADLGSGSIASGEFSLSESEAGASGAAPAKSAAKSAGEFASGAESALDLDLPAGDARERTGVSIFDADELDLADPSAVTQLTDEGGFGELQLDSVGSGSGLLDLTRESDDTSLGSEFLEELYPSDEGTVDRDVPAGGLFETTGEDAAGAAGLPAGAMVMAEPIDAAGSGLTAGLSIGAVLALTIGLVAAIIGIMGAPAEQLLNMLADNFIVIVGASAGLTLILGVIGLLLGKRAG